MKIYPSELEAHCAALDDTGPDALRIVENRRDGAFYLGTIQETADLPGREVAVYEPEPAAAAEVPPAPPAPAQVPPSTPTPAPAAPPVAG